MPFKETTVETPQGVTYTGNSFETCTISILIKKNLTKIFYN